MKKEAAFKVGDIIVDPASNELRGSDMQVHLQPQVMDLLVLLAERHGELISREDLIQSIWHGYPGADQSLFNAASKLRHALEEVGGHRELLRTVPKRGYSLESAVEPIASRERWKSWWVLAIVSILAPTGIVLTFWFSNQVSDSLTPSVVVLPFDSLSNDENDEYFADGLTEEILSSLAGVPGIKVTGRTSSFYFKHREVSLKTIGETLGVANALSGSVRRSGDRLRITLQLISIEDGFPLWSQTYDREMADIFDVQENIARHVVTALNRELLTGTDRLTSPPISDPELHLVYLTARGRLQTGRTDDLLVAERLFDQILEQDPSHHQAMAGAYLTQRDLWFQAAHKAWSEYYTQGQRMLETALSIAPDSALAHTAYASLQAHKVLLELGNIGPFGIRDLAFVGYMIDSAQLVPAESSVLRALELAPDSPEALSTLALIRTARQTASLDEVLGLYDRALQIEPLARNIQLLRADAFAAYGRPSESIAEYRRLVTVYPDFADAWFTLAVLALKDGGRLAEAFAHAERARQITDGIDFPAITVLGPIWWEIGMQETAIEVTELDQGSPWSRLVRRWMIESFLRGDYEAAHELSSKLAEEAQIQLWDFWAIADAIQADDPAWALAQIESRFSSLVVDEPQIEWGNLQIAPQLAYLLATAGHKAEAATLCESGWAFLARQPKSIRQLHWYFDLQCHAILGNNGPAIETVRAAVDSGYKWFWMPGFGTLIDRLKTLGPLLDDPQYLAIMDEIRKNAAGYRDEIIRMDREGLPPISEVLDEA